MLDASDHLVTRRLDLAVHANGTRASEPGLHTEDIAQLATAVARAIGGGAWKPKEGHHELQSFAFDDWPVHQATAWWMRELGYPLTEARSHFNDVRLSSTAYVEIRTKDTAMSLGDIQRVYANAVVEARKPLVFTTGYLTRDAVKWADKAKIAVFLIHDDFSLRPLSSFAVEHVPAVL